MVALACAALVVSLQSASGSALRRTAACAEPPDTSTHWEAVFSHTTSLSQAVVLRQQLLAKAIKGVQFEQDYCDDIELIVTGLDTPEQRKAFQKEADTSNVPVAFEAPEEQKQNAKGEVTAVFGHLPTLKRASQLQNDIAVKGWRDNDLVRLGLHDWKVVVRHLPASIEASFAAEAKGGGYRVTFEG